MITFKNIDKQEIKEKHKNCFFENADYFKAEKNNNLLFYFGIFNRGNNECDVFWILDSFNEGVFRKYILVNFFEFIFSQGYKNVYGYISSKKYPKMLSVFERFSFLGIEKTTNPWWDSDNNTRCWFIKRM